VEFEVKIKKLIKARSSTNSTNTVSLLEWVEKYLDFCQGRMTERVFKEKKEDLKWLCQGLDPDMPVEEITPELALNKLKSLAEIRTGYTANKTRKNLIAAWNWGQKFISGWTQNSNPFALVPKFPYSKKAKYVPPMEDVEKVMSVMNEDDRTMLLCFLHTGARKNEIFKLKWSDVDFANNQIWLTTRKRKDGMEERDSLPMTQELRQALLRHRGKYGQYEYVFVSNKKGDPYKDRNQWLPRACKKAGVRAFRFHAIRHLTASWLDAHNVPLTTIQRILRHRNPHTTARYLHELRGVQISLDEVFDKKKSGKILEFKKEKASNE
jgi:integrase